MTARQKINRRRWFRRHGETVALTAALTVGSLLGAYAAGMAIYLHTLGVF